jgi:hypothetical protein
MAWGSRVLLCCVLGACAGDNRLDPSQLELRDVLGIAPETAMTWDRDQRASARHVIDAAMHETAVAIHAPLGGDRNVPGALAAADADREDHHQPALGVVALALQPAELQATVHPSTLAARATPAIELELSGWSEHPGWASLPARGLDVLAKIASDAGHREGPIIAIPAAQLPVIAAYLPGTPAHLLVNPVVLASLEPVTGVAAAPIAIADDPVGNPYTFYSSVAECAAAQQARCDACVPNHSCAPITEHGDGTAQCQQLAADDGRGYSLVCINFALAIDSVASCAAATAPSCPIDRNAELSLTTNADFLDRTECAGPLDRCLAEHSGATTPAPTPTPDNSLDCSDSACAASPNCDDAGCDGGSCDDTGDDGCSDDSGDSSCDSGDGGDCGGDSGGDCGGDSGGGCSGDSGGDCAGDSGGDCSGGGGDDCNAGGHRRRDRREPHHGYLWACLPLPFAVIARRRAARRRREVAS